MGGRILLWLSWLTGFNERPFFFGFVEMITGATDSKYGVSGGLVVKMHSM